MCPRSWFPGDNGVRISVLWPSRRMKMGGHPVVNAQSCYCVPASRKRMRACLPPFLIYLNAGYQIRYGWSAGGSVKTWMPATSAGMGTLAWWHSQSTAVWSLSQAGRPVLGAVLNCSESALRSAKMAGGRLRSSRGRVGCTFSIWTPTEGYRSVWFAN